MTENDVNPPINNDPMEKRNEFIDHPSYHIGDQEGSGEPVHPRSLARAFAVRTHEVRK